jgi:outer membrane protein assembly factor BamB
MSQAGLQLCWERHLSLAPGELAVKLWVIDENLYFLTSQKMLIAMDAKTGRMKWRVVVTYRNERVFAPSHFDEMPLPKRVGTVEDIKNPPSPSSLPKFDALCINTLTSMKVIDRATGEMIRDIPFHGFAAVNCGATDGERFYVAGSDKQLYAISLLPAVKIWSHELDANALAPVLCDDTERVFVATQAGLLQCLSADDQGQAQWRIKFDAAITAPMALAEGSIYVASQEGRVYGLARNNGKAIHLPAQVLGRPVGVFAGDSALYVVSSPGGVTSIDRASGKVRWNIPTGQTILAAIDGKVYLQDQAGNLRVVQADTGKTTHAVPMGRHELLAANVSAPAIYVATQAGKITCIRQASETRLAVDMLKK